MRSTTGGGELACGGGREWRGRRLVVCLEAEVEDDLG